MIIIIISLLLIKIDFVSYKLHLIIKFCIYDLSCFVLFVFTIVAILVPGVQVAARAGALSSPSLCRERQPLVGSLLLLGREQLRNEIILSRIMYTNAELTRDTNASPYIDEQRCRGGVERRNWSTSHCRQLVTPYYVRAGKGR